MPNSLLFESCVAHTPRRNNFATNRALPSRYRGVAQLIYLEFATQLLHLTHLDIMSRDGSSNTPVPPWGLGANELMPYRKSRKTRTACAPGCGSCSNRISGRPIASQAAANVSSATFRLHVGDVHADAGLQTQALDNASGHIMDTNMNGACAIHAVFGVANDSRELFCIDARQLIERLLQKPLAAVRHQLSFDAGARQALEDIEASIWHELTLPLLKAEHEEAPISNEQFIFKAHFFGDPAMRSCVMKCREHYCGKRLATEAQKDLLVHAREVFRPEYSDCVWQPLGMQRDVRWPQYKYERLFDLKEENDKERNAFLCALCGSSDFRDLPSMLLQGNLKTEDELPVLLQEELNKFATDILSAYNDVEPQSGAPTRFAEEV